MGDQLSYFVGKVRIPHQAARAQQLIASSPNMLLSGSRDKSLIIWTLTRDEQNYGFPKRSLHGHSHIVSDCVYLLFLDGCMKVG